LYWIAYARRLLSVGELQHALAVHPGMTEMDSYDIGDKHSLTSVCSGLVAIDQNMIVRLVRKYITGLLNMKLHFGLIFFRQHYTGVSPKQARLFISKR
jgi:hypothetical protein